MTVSEPAHHDSDRLAQALQTLQAASPRLCATGREIISPGAADPLSSLQSEINRTILRRRLNCTNDRGETISLEVVERRVVHLTCSKNQEFDFAPDDDPATISGKKVILDFCDASTSITVQSSLVPKTAHSTSIGLPAHSLSQADQAIAPTGHALTNYVACIRSEALACVCLSDGITVEAWGSAGLVERLSACIEDADQTDDNVTIWVVPSTRGIGICHIRQGKCALWVAIDPQHISRLCTYWAELLDAA